MANILAIDPGGETGLAVRKGELVMTLTCMQPRQLVEWITEFEWHVVICEGFNTTNMISAWGLYTVELVGAVKALCIVGGIPYVIQRPDYRYSSLHASKEWHKNLHESPMPVVHRIDALAHLLAYEEKGPPKLTKSIREW